MRIRNAFTFTFILIYALTFQKAFGQCEPVLNSSSGSSLCAGDDLTLNASFILPSGCLVAPGNSYEWAGPGGVPNTSSPTTTVNNAQAGNYTVVIDLIDDGSGTCPCNAGAGFETDVSNSITVQSLPGAPSASDETICSEETAILTVTSGSGDYYWYDAASGGSLLGNGISYTTPTLTTPVGVVSTVSYYVAEQVNGCEGPRTEVDVTVNPSPPDPTVSGDVICPGTTATLTASGSGTLNWYDSPTGGTLLNTGGTYTTPTLTQTTIFYVEAVLGTGCISNRVSVTVTVLPATPIPVANDTTICEGDIAVISAIGTGTSGNSLRWYDVAVAGTPLETDAMPPSGQTYSTAPFALTVTTVFYVAEFNPSTGCESERKPITVVVNPEVPEPIGLDTAICEGQPVTLTAQYGVGSNNGDLQWFDQATGGTLLQVGQSYTVSTSITSTPGIYQFYVEEDFNGCTSPTRDQVTLTVNTNPANPTVTGATICEGETAVISASGSGGALNWYSDGSGVNLIFTGSNFTTQALTQNTTYYVQELNSSTGCSSDLIPVDVIVNPNPAAPTGSSVSVCDTDPAIITASGTGNVGTQLVLFTVPTGGTPLLTGALAQANVSFDLSTSSSPPAVGSTTYYIEEQNTSTGCISARTPVTVNVGVSPAAPFATDVAICEDETATLSATSSGSTSGTMNWYSDAALTNLIFTGGSFTTPVLAATTVYYVTELANKCESSANQVTVTVNPNPAAPIASNTSACSGQPTTLSATGSGGTLNWYSDGSGLNLVGSGSTFTTPSLSQSTTYYVQEVTVGTGCMSDLVPVEITITALPNSPSAPDIQACSDEDAILTVTGSGNAGTQINVYTVATGGTPIATGTPGTSPVSINLGQLSASATYYLEEENTGTGCFSVRTPVSITISTLNQGPTVPGATICEGEKAILTATSNGSGTGFMLWYSDPALTNLVFTGNSYSTDPLFTTTTFYVVEDDDICVSPETAVTVTVNAIPPDPVPTPVTICAGETATITATVSGGTIRWYDDPNGLNLVATGPSFTTPVLQVTTNYYVEETSVNGCISNLVVATVTVTPLPPGPSANSVTVCADESVIISATGSFTGTIAVYTQATGGTLLTSQAIPPLNVQLDLGILPVGNYTYYLEENNGTCASTRTPVSVTVLPVPSAPTISPPAITCEGSSATLTAISTNSSTGIFNWYAASDSSLLFTGNPFTTVNLLATTSFIVTETINGCESPGTIFVVNVSPNPADPIGIPATICSGETATLGATGTSGNLLSWYSDPSGLTLVGTGSTFTTPALTNSTTYYVQETSTGTGCVSNLVPVTATVVPLPPTPTANSVTVCADESVIISASGSTSGTLDLYNQATGGTLLSSQSIPPLSVQFDLGILPVGTYTYYIEENNGTCSSVRTPVSVTVLPVPTAPTVSPPASTCVGNSATLTAISTNTTTGVFNWYAASDSSLLFSGNPFTTVNLLTTTSFIVTETINGCESAGTIFVVNVSPNPADPTGIPATICSGEPATLSATGTSGNLLSWYSDPSGLTLVGTGSTFTTPALTNSTTYYVQETSTGTGCVSNLVPVTATVVPLPPAPTANSVTVCADESVIISASGSTSGTLDLYNQATGGTLLSSQSIPPLSVQFDLGILPVGTYTYYIEENNGTCSSVRTPVSVTVLPVPTSPTVTPPASTCAGDAATLIANSTNSTTGVFNWYAASDSSLLFTGNPFTTVNLLTTTSFIVTETINGCESAGTIFVVNVSPNPADPIGIPATICSGETATLGATGTTGNLLSWYSDPSGLTLVGTGSTFTTPVLTSSTIYYVQETASGSGCTSNLVAVSVTVLSLPIAPASSDLTICATDTAILTAIGSGTGSLVWYDVATGGLPLQTNSMPPATATYTALPTPPVGSTIYYVAENNGTCESPRTPITVTVLAIPSAPLSTGTTICEGNSATLTASTSTGSTGVFNWYDALGNFLFIGNSFNTGILTSTTTFQVTEVQNGCESNPTSVTVLVNPNPAVPTVVPDTICEGATALLSATPVDPTHEINWYSDPNGTTLIASNTTSYTTSALFSNTTFWVEAENPSTSCVSNLVPVNVVVLPAPVSPSAFDITICVGDTGVITAAGSGTGSLVWYTVATGGIPIQTNPMPPANATLTVGPFGIAGVNVFYVEENNGSCASPRTAVTVTVLDGPAAPIVSGQTICEGGSALLSATSGGGTSGTFNWYDATGTSLLFFGSPFNTGPLTFTTTYQVTEVLNGCESVPTVVTVVVNPNPGNPTVPADTVCDGEAAVLTATPNTAGNVINWYSDGLGGNLIFTGPTYTSPPLTQATTFWIQEVAAGTGCKSNLVAVTVTVQAAPSPPSSTNLAICEGEQGNITASGSGSGSLVWYDALGNLIQTDPMPPSSATLTVGPFSTGTYVFYVAEDNGACESAQTPITVTVDPEPSSPLISGVIVCAGSSATLTANYGGSTTGSFNWYDATGSFLLFTGNPYNTGPLSLTTVYQVTESVNGCESAPALVTVVVQPLPADPIAIGDTICAGTTATLTATPSGAGNILSWYDDPTGTTFLGNGTSFTTPILTNNAVFYVQEQVPGTGCVSNFVPVLVEVLQGPPSPTASNLTVCQADTIVITAAGSGSGVLNWYDAIGNLLEVDLMPPANATLILPPGLPAGIYVYYVEEDNGGCASAQTPITVTVIQGPGAPLAPGVTVCQGDQATLTATHSGATSGVFNWYDATGTIFLGTGASFTTPGLLTSTDYQVTEVENGCESPATIVTVTVNPFPGDPFIAPVSICAGDSVTLSAIPADPSHVLSWYADNAGTVLIATGNSYTTPILTQDEIYYVQATIPGTGCKGNIIAVFVTVLATPTPPASSNISLCALQVATLSASGSGTGFLRWYDGAGTLIQVSPMPPAASTLQVGPFAPGSGPFTYYIDEYNGVCASSQTPITVIIEDAPTAPIAPGTSICAGESANLTATSTSGSSSQVFNWYDVTGTNLLYTGSTFNTGTLNVTTTFLVREEVLPCESPNTSVTVVVNPTPANPIVVGDTVCNGGSATLNAIGQAGNFLNWYSDPVGSNLLFTGNVYVTTPLAMTTTYWVQQVIIGTGCRSSLIPVTASVGSLPVAPSGTDIVICEGDVGQIVASGTGNPNTQLNWYDVATGSTPLQSDLMGPNTTATLNVGPLAPGLFTFYVEEQDLLSGCSSSRTSITVLVNPTPPEPSVNDVTICVGESATLVAPGPGTFLWYNALTGGSLLSTGLVYDTGILTDSITVFVSQIVDGCESPREPVVVFVGALPSVPMISNNGPLCEGDTLFLMASTLTNVVYNWTGPNGFTSTQQNPVIPNVTEADHQGEYTLSVISIGNGCSSGEARMNVSISARPQTPSLATNSPVCEGQQLILTSNPIPGAGVYVWTGPNGLDTTTSTHELIIPITTAADSGVYSVYVRANGCLSLAATAQVVILGGSAVPAATNNGPLCEGQDLELSATQITGAIYNWTGPNGFTSNNQNPIIASAEQTDAGTYSVTITAGNCPTSAPGMTTVLIDPIPVIGGVMSNGPVCEGETLELTAPFIAGVDYLWTGPNGFTATDPNVVIADAKQADHQGTYSLVVTDQLTGCPSEAITVDVIISISAGFLVIADNSGPVCEGDDIELSVNTNAPNPTYQWSGPNGFSSTEQNPTLTGVTSALAGNYVVLVNGAGGCDSTSATNVTTVAIDETLLVDAGPDSTILQGTSIRLQASGGVSFFWEPGLYLDNPTIADPVATPPVGTITYSVTGISLSGCEGSDQVTITVEPNVEEDLGAYDLFTPNGDGINDFFVIRYMDNITEPYTFVLIDRGGAEIVSTQNYQNNWDGTWNGRPVPEGTYWWVIRTADQEYKGAVTLIR